MRCAWQGCSAALAILRLYPGRTKRPVPPPMCAPARPWFPARSYRNACNRRSTACRTAQQRQELLAAWEKLLNEARLLRRPCMRAEQRAAARAVHTNAAPVPPTAEHKLAAAAA